MLLTDIARALVYTNHELLIAKLHAYGFRLDSLTLVQNYLFNPIQRLKTNASFTDYGNAELLVLEWSISGTLCFDVFICDLFFEDTKIL